MFDVDTLIKKLVLERGIHGPIRCCACIVDGDGQKIVHAIELPYVEFHEAPEGDFIQIVFHGVDDDDA